jgi:hypothetical protein
MIIKKMDSKQEELAELTGLLKGRLTSNQRLGIEREVRGKKKRDVHAEHALHEPWST